MPIIKSAKKRVRTAEKAAIRNSKTKRSLRTALKAFRSVVAGGENSTDVHNKAQSALDTAAKKGLLHKNKVARQKSQLARLARQAASADTATASVPAKKTAPKKAVAAKTTAAKKAVTAKQAPVKAAVRKPAAKKPAAK